MTPRDGTPPRPTASRAGVFHVAIVASELPERQPAGHNLVLRDFIHFFRDRGFRISLLVTEPRLGFVARRRAGLDYELHGRGLLEFAGWYVTWSPLSALSNGGWQVFFRLPARAQSAISCLRDLVREWRGIDHVIGSFPSSRSRHFVNRRLTELAPHLVFYNGIFCFCGDPGSSLSKARRYVITHDVKFQRARSFRDLGYRVSPARFDAGDEKAILEKVGNIIAIQRDDAATFRSLNPEANVLTVPAAIPARPRPPEEQPNPRKCLFVASGSLHNVDGIAWFLRDCWPAITRAVPDACLNIVGSVCARLGDLPRNVVAEGVIDDIDIAYRDTAVCIVPLRAGSGLKIKLAEGLAHGVAVVTTSVGAQGLTDIAPMPFRLADQATEFAAAVIELLTEPEQRRALEIAASRAAARFSLQAAFSELAADLERTLGSELMRGG